MNAGVVNNPRSQDFSAYSGLLLAFVLVGASFPDPPEKPVPLQATQRASITLEGYFYKLAFTADANALACVSLPPPSNRPGEVRLWYRAGDRELITALPDTAGMVHALVFTPDGKTLATGGSASADPANAGAWEGVVKLWEVATGKEQAVFKGHTSYVVSLKFSPDGKTLASATQAKMRSRGENELKLWDVATGRALATIRGDGGGASLLELAPDGKTLAWGYHIISNERVKPEIKLIDMGSGREWATLKGLTYDLKCMAFSPDGKTLATGGGLPVGPPPRHSRGRNEFRREPGELKLWEVATGKERANLQGHSACVLSVAFAPDGKTLAAGGAGTPMSDRDKYWYWSGEAKLWDVTTGKERVYLRGHPFPRGTVEYVTFSADGTRLASTGGNVVKLWDTATGKELAEVRGDPLESWFWAAFTRKGMVLLSRPQITGRGHDVLKIWDVLAVK
jgi:WD40 repeat protein